MKGDQGDYTMTISTLLYKGELCLHVTDTYLDYDKIISTKEKVRKIYVKRVLSYDGASYIRKYKKTK